MENQYLTRDLYLAAYLIANKVRLIGLKKDDPRQISFAFAESERNLEMFRDKIYDKLIIKKENFPESYFELQKRIARERGQAVEEIPPDVREQMMDVAIEDQKHSLDAWMEYLTSNDAVYPAWFKYYAWNQIIKISQFDKERGEFKKRTVSSYMYRKYRFFNEKM